MEVLVTSNLCLTQTSRYYIKTSVHSYFNIIKRSITLKCPTFVAKLGDDNGDADEGDVVGGGARASSAGEVSLHGGASEAPL